LARVRTFGLLVHRDGGLGIRRAIGLPKLGRLDSQQLAQRGKLDVILDAASFITQRQKLFEGFVRDARKSEGCRFAVKQWNQVERKFEEDIYLWFEDNVAGGLTKAHGPLSCHFTANNERGNWLDMHYHWPPAQGDDGKIRVNLSRKSIVNSTSWSVSPEEHDQRCRYRKDDASGEIARLSQFASVD
jgi:hypothetical protein